MSDHREKAWFARAMEFNGKLDEIYSYGIQAVKQRGLEFHARGFHRAIPYSEGYQPNPFRFQYDLTMYIWLNFFQILKEEIKILRTQKKEEAADRLSIEKTLYGITRSDFLFAAAEMRWPTTIIDGKQNGCFMRDPWSEKRVAAISDEEHKYVISFGGGGQGKTHVSLAFALMIFDHFIFTNKGARCMISTVSEDKLKSASWSYLCRVHAGTKKDISLYAGKAKISGDFTLTRPNHKDAAGVFKGILIGNQINDQKIIDKLTGTHGHPFIVYIMDEIQSTPSAPITAAPNFTMHAGDFRILGAGNWGENNDTLANNVKPDTGWDSVDENSGSWISTMQNHSKCITLHFNNNNSPGMVDGDRFWYLPNEKTLKRNYPTPASRNPVTSISYRRFWIGWRLEATGMKNVIYDTLIKENLANLPLELTQVLHTFFTFDSAQAEIDRNFAIVCQEGICALSKQRVFGPMLTIVLDKSTDSMKYFEESSNQLMDITRKHNIKSGAGIVDWTGRPAHAERLLAKGFAVQKLVYNKAVPDGKVRDEHTKRVEREIPLNVQLDFKQEIPANQICAHHVAENEISLGAWALREYAKCGRLRGINENLIRYLNNPRSLEDELYNREFRLKSSKKYGDRFHLEPKSEFKAKYGFSPDILDNLFQMAYYMLKYRHLPLTPVDNGDNLLIDNPSEEPDEINKMWEEDDVFSLEI